MKSSWIKDLDTDQKKEIESDYRAAANLRERLRTMLKSDQEDQLKYSRGKDKYAEPNWALFQADTCGYNRALNHIISLLE